jgi:hypothetical protein
MQSNVAHQLRDEDWHASVRLARTVTRPARLLHVLVRRRSGFGRMSFRFLRNLVLNEVQEMLPDNHLHNLGSFGSGGVNYFCRVHVAAGPVERRGLLR